MPTPHPARLHAGTWFAGGGGMTLPGSQVDLSELPKEEGSQAPPKPLSQREPEGKKPVHTIPVADGETEAVDPVGAGAFCLGVGVVG